MNPIIFANKFKLWHMQVIVHFILNWLYVYGAFDIAENATVGNEEVNYHDEKIATYTSKHNITDQVLRML